MDQLRASNTDFIFDKLTTAEVTTLIEAWGAPPTASWDEVWMLTSNDGRAEVDFFLAGCLTVYSDTLPTQELLRLIGRAGA